MKILHWIKKEDSGLFRTAMELALMEEKMGHSITVRQPKDKSLVYGFEGEDFDIHCIHSQINPDYYKDSKPKILFLHGEPDYGMLVKISINAIMDLIPILDAMVCFNEAESRIWQSFKRTFTITKGIDLDSYYPKDYGKKLVGSPAILYAEHWRQFRHPLHTFIALEEVHKKLPGMRFYPFGCPPDEKPFWLRLVNNNKYGTFTPGVFPPQKHMPALLNMADIVVSPVFPSYGRVSLEALACNKPVVGYNTNPHATYKVDPYQPDQMAQAILACWETKPNGQRHYAEENLSAKKMAEEAVAIYGRFIG